MLYVDTKTWLPDDLLVKADKMTMANSLELRVPLLDHKVLEFAASFAPSDFKVHRFTLRVHSQKSVRKPNPPQAHPDAEENRISRSLRALDAHRIEGMGTRYFVRSPDGRKRIF